MVSDIRLTSQHTKSEMIRCIRSALLEQGSATKVELSHNLQISFPTISKFLKQMEDRGEVTTIGLDESSGGRRAIRYTYRPDYMLGLAIFLEKSETNYTVFNCLGEVIEQGNTHSMLEQDVLHLTTFIENIRNAYPNINAVAIGVPGAVNNGKIFLIPGYENYHNLDLKKHIEEQLSIPTVVENDMNAAVIGYMAQRKIGDNISLFYLYLGQNGPGAGIVINGEIVRGKTFFSGEVSFVPQYDDRNFLQALTNGNGGEMSIVPMEKKVDAISRLVASITSILNPHYIIFGDDEIETLMLHQIAERSATYVPKEHLPELAASDLKHDYLNGLQCLGLSLLISQQIDD
ncbi:ROK family transcriptional regulator [Paenibacillus glacialis]|uniref:ROK family transcriptional regulator n=1 Tax=Paenibacillus glacialis TaxID=494026 RepID=UPI000A9EDE0E|nr:ROK family transcriptional regulator [Paenibacillus glacialis]